MRSGILKKRGRSGSTPHDPRSRIGNILINNYPVAFFRKMSQVLHAVKQSELNGQEGFPEVRKSIVF
jgi:hypothetical protein